MAYHGIHIHDRGGRMDEIGIGIHSLKKIKPGASYQNMDSSDLDDDGDEPTVECKPTTNSIRWSHIEDLDTFFSRIYIYHQTRGFFCIFLKGFLDLVKVVFMAVFCVVLTSFIKYDILFKDKLPPRLINATNVPQKILFSDVVCPLSECWSDIGGLTWTCLAVVCVFWMFRLVKLVYNLYQFWDIKGFFNTALRIPDTQLENITWHEIQQKICEVQREQQMCIRKNNLTELDIYHRILRSKNYMVAMINKRILPTDFYIPFVGSVNYLSQGMKYNIELLLFSGTWGFFQNWHLKEDYKKANKRLELATKLERTILWFTLGNLLFGCFIFLWQLVYFLFNYAEVLKREPGVLGLRCWSLYSRLYLRHFNELDHELDARLRRAYKPASRYMDTFSSPLSVIVAENILFMAGSALAVLLILSAFDEDVLAVQHVVTMLTILLTICGLAKGSIPNENVWWDPEMLMIEVLAEVHYLPDSWRGKAHTTQVRNEFSQFFQYKASALLFELISPLVTPFIFYFKLRSRSLDIVDFYRNFTVAVVGVGDVCSFSLMDMRKHGNPTWQSPERATCAEATRQTQAEDGKTELSLIHFAAMNPTWHPPQDAEQFIHEIRENARHRAQDETDHDRHSEALNSVSAGLGAPFMMMPFTGSCTEQGIMAGPAIPPVLTSQIGSPHHSEGDYRVFGNILSKHNSINTLYLHSMHHKKIQKYDFPRELTATRSSINALPGLSKPSTSGTRTSTSMLSEGTPLLTFDRR